MVLVVAAAVVADGVVVATVEFDVVVVAAVASVVDAAEWVASVRRLRISGSEEPKLLRCHPDCICDQFLSSSSGPGPGNQELDAEKFRRFCNVRQSATFSSSPSGGP